MLAPRPGCSVRLRKRDEDSQCRSILYKLYKVTVEYKADSDGTLAALAQTSSGGLSALTAQTDLL